MRTHGSQSQATCFSTRTSMDKCGVNSMETSKTKAFANASKPGEPKTTEDFDADEIGTSMEAYSRARAFFATLPVVMILDQTFFSVQDALFIDNNIFFLVQMTVYRPRPPRSFFAAAWASMLQRSADEIRSNQKKVCLYCPGYIWMDTLLDDLETSSPV